MSAAVVSNASALDNRRGWPDGLDRSDDGCADSRTPSSGAAFYRKYTEQLLQRYVRTSMQLNRRPPMIDKDVFPGKSSHTRMRCFDDGLIFVLDMEKCLNKLDRGGLNLVTKIALQAYTQQEAARIYGMSVRTVMRRYGEALDALTDILLEVDLLDGAEY